MLKFARKRFLFSSLPSSTILRSVPEGNMHEQNSFGKKINNNQSKGRLENRFTLVYWTKPMDRNTPPKSTGLADLLR